MGRAAALAVALAALPGCLQGWPLGGPWACSADQTCPGGATCDEGVCCDPVSERGCPTVPHPVTLECGVGSGRKATLFHEDRDEDADGNPRVTRYLCALPRQARWVTASGDCDDEDPAINSRAAERCNGLDDNCDGDLDEGLSRSRWYRDADGDGFGDDADSVLACAAPPGYVAAAGDCAPFDPTKFPGAPELCNGLDDDCDGVPDTGEAVFADTDGPGGARFPCVSGRPGICAPGTFRCEPRGAGVVRECVALRPPERLDVCDGLDNDCDGTVDQWPSCGGPTTPLGLLGPGVTRGALAGSRFLPQDSSCLRGRMSIAGSWSDATRVWSSSTDPSEFQLWYAEAPAAAPWDLSRPNLKLRVRLSVTAGNTTAFGDGGHFGHPVVYLCGESDTDIIRYVATGARLANGTMEVDQTFTLGAPTGFIIGRGSGFDTRRVRRVEVLFWKLSNFSIRVGPETGFVP